MKHGWHTLAICTHSIHSDQILKAQCSRFYVNINNLSILLINNSTIKYLASNRFPLKWAKNAFKQKTISQAIILLGMSGSGEGKIENNGLEQLLVY